MATLKKEWAIILIILILASGLFYWNEWRPLQIKKECFRHATNYAWGQTYDKCMLASGIKE